MRLLRQPRLALFFAGGALNAIGTWATLIALWGFAAYHFHSGPDQIAILGLAWTAPGALFSLVSGLPIDRFGPKVILIASDVLGLSTALAMAAAHSYSTLLLLAVASGVVQAFGRPAGSSLPPRIVEDRDLLAANSLMGVAEQSAIVFGPLAGSLAINLWGLRAAFLFDAATFALGLLAVLPLRLHPIGERSPRRSMTKELLAGFDLAAQLVTVRRLLMLAAAMFCSWGAYLVMEPIYVRDTLHRSPAVLGLLQTCFGVGLIGATIALPRLGDRVVNIRSVSFSIVACGVAAALYVATHYLAVAAVGVFLWGIAVGFFISPVQTLLQRATPAETHGRVMSLLSAVDGFGGLASIPLTGVIVGAIGIADTGAIVGVLLVLTGVSGLLTTYDRPYLKSWSRAAAMAE